MQDKLMKTMELKRIAAFVREHGFEVQIFEGHCVQIAIPFSHAYQPHGIDYVNVSTMRGAKLALGY